MFHRLIRFIFSVKMLKIAAGLIVLLGLAVVAAYLWIDRQGSAAWKEYLAAHPDTPVDLKPFIPPTVPPAQNFANIPLFMKPGTAGGPTPLDLPKDLNWSPSLAQAERTDMARLRDRFVDKGALENPTDNPAQDLLRALERYEPHLQQIRDAAARPASQFPVDWTKGMMSDMPHIGLLRKATRLFRLRGLCLLQLGDGAAALRELEFIQRIHEAQKPEPMLISGVLRSATLGEIHSVIWEGLAARQWKEPELVRLDEMLSKIDVLADARYSLASERGAFNQSLDQVYRKGGKALEELGQQRPDDLYLSIYPRGWIRSSQVASNRCFDEAIDRLKGPIFIKEQPVYREVEKAWAKSLVHVYKDAMTKIMLPSITGMDVNFWSYHAQNSQARVAIALERHRLAQGSYPETLDALPGPLPPDPMNGKPCGYRRTEEGYLLWSVAMNLVDDKGERGTSQSKRSMLDWTWEVPGTIQPSSRQGRILGESP